MLSLCVLPLERWCGLFLSARQVVVRALQETTRLLEPHILTHQLLKRPGTKL